MTSLDATLEAAFEVRPEVSALAWLDGRAGILLGLMLRNEIPREVVETAAFSAPQLLALPRLEDESAGPEATCPDSFIESDGWIHAFARVPAQPDFIVMGLAPQGTNVALLRAWLGEVAVRVGRVS